MIGRPLRRLEDHRLITGQGRYVDDISTNTMLHVIFVRSVEAHALIGPVSLDPAYSGPATLFTAASLELERPQPTQNPTALLKQAITPPPLAVDEVCYVGQPIAVVIAPTVQEAFDATEMVEVEYEPVPVIIDHRKALDEDAPLAHRGTESNLVATLAAGFGDVAGAFAAADRTLSIVVDQHRGALASLEGRGVMARWDDVEQRLTLFTSTQSPHAVRDNVASYLGLSSEDLRVVAPDVGGGFGPKAVVYPEEVVLTALALRLRRPVKWTELRREHFTATTQQRGQTGAMEAAVNNDGTILAFRARFIHDSGAYVPYGVVVPLTTLRLLSGPYVVPALDAQIECVFTNATPTGAIRGAARPNATFAVERMMDAIAHELDIDRAEVRRRNMIQPASLPYKVDIAGSDGRPVTYDSGDYPEALEAALEAAGISDFETRQKASTKLERRRGYGIASYVEDTGLGPYDGARIEILTNGDVVVSVGSPAQGQGHGTVLAQIVAEHLGVNPNRVRTHGGDTAQYGQGIGTVASRTAVTVASAVNVAAADLAGTVKDLAAAKLEAAVEDIVLVGGTAMVIGQPGTEIPLGDLASSAQPKFGGSIPEGQQSPGLSAERVLPYGGAGYTHGTHIAEVEIDPETGHIDVVGYVVVHDCGNLLNPMIVDGQIDGGVAHGLGNALTEHVQYWDSGQPQTTSFMDYRLMSAVDMPTLIKVHRETPSPTNPLGAKGAGEGGTIPAAAAVASAVEHALADLGATVNHYPISAEWVFQTLQQSEG